MFNGFVLRTLLASVLLAAPTIVLSQDKPVEALPVAAGAPKEKLTDIEMLKLKLSLEQQKRVNAQYAAAIEQCRAQPNLRQIIDEAAAIDAEQNKMLTAAFQAHGLDATKNKVDPATGEFVPNK